MNWLIDYYHNWLSGGWFFWEYPINGIEAPAEYWHTPFYFWMTHGVIVIGGAVLAVLFIRYICGKLTDYWRVKR